MSKKASNFQKKVMSLGYHGKEIFKPLNKRQTDANPNDSVKPRLLLFGAGVIGAYLAHVLIEAGNDVTILARQERAESINRNGLEIYHHLQRKTTKDNALAVTSVDGMKFDAVFVVMPFHKLQAALPQIYEFNTDLLVLIGNNLASADIYEKICTNATGIGKVLFGFQVTGGKKEKDRYICERLGGSYMDIGQLHGDTDSDVKGRVEKLFEGTSYKLNWQGDMEEYLVCHPAAILPIVYLTYLCDGDLRKSTREQRKMMFDASHEAYDFLKAKGITIYPVGDDKFYGNGVRGKLMTFLYFAMSKSSIGDLVACEHCRNAVTEMEQIDLFYEELMKDYPREKLTTWNRLRTQMPSWSSIHQKYGN